MFYEKTLLVKRTSQKIIPIKFDGGINTVVDEMSLPQNVAVCEYNCSGASGGLKSIGGIDKLTLSANGVSYDVVSPDGKFFVNGWYYTLNNGLNRDDRLIMLLDDHTLYDYSFVGNANPKKIEGITLSGRSCGVRYKIDQKDCLLLSSDVEGMYVYDGSTVSFVPTAPKMISMCIHYERLFATSGDNVLWFSDDLNPTNWNISLDQAGYIEFSDNFGKIIKVISYLDNVFVFRQFGITKLTAYAEQESFSVTQLFCSSGIIYPKTVTICGDIVMFLASDGLYVFNGVNAVKVLGNLNIFDQSNQQACGIYDKGKYILACKLKFSAGEGVLCEKSQYKNNALIYYDLDKRQQEIVRGIDCLEMINCLNDSLDLAVILNGQAKLGKLSLSHLMFELPLPYIRVCPLTDLGLANRYKLIKSVMLLTKQKVTIKIELDGKTFYFDVFGSKEIQEVRINMQAKLIKISFLGVDADIRATSLLYSVC